MARRLLVLAIGRDRPGLIAGITSAIAGANGNIEDMDQVVLRGVFVMSLVAEFSDSVDVGELRRALSEVGEGLGLRVHVYDFEELGAR